MQRKAFALLTAIAVLIIVLSISSLLLNFSGISKQLVLDDFYKSQTKFYEKSSISIITKKLQLQDINTSCLEVVDLDFGKYSNRTEIFYKGNNLPCNVKYILDNNETNLTIIMQLKTRHKTLDYSLAKQITKSF